MNRTEHLLVCLAEECAEVGHAVGKALRFGLDDAPPFEVLKNREYIVREMNDILAVIELLRGNGVPLEGIGYRVAIDDKKAKLEKFMEYAEQRGTLTPNDLGNRRAAFGASFATMG